MYEPIKKSAFVDTKAHFRNVNHPDSATHIYSAKNYISFVSRDGTIYKSFTVQAPNLCWLQNSNELLDLLNQAEEEVSVYLEKEPIDERIHRSYKTALERLEDQK